MNITRGPSRVSNWPSNEASTDSKEPSQFSREWIENGGSPYHGFNGGCAELKGTKNETHNETAR